MRTIVVLALLGFFALSLADTETLEAGIANVETVAAEDVPVEVDRPKLQDWDDEILEAIDDALAIKPKKPVKPKGPKKPPSKPAKPTKPSRVGIKTLLRVMEAVKRLAKVKPSASFTPVVSRMLAVMKEAGINVAPLVATLRRMGVKLSGDPVSDFIILEEAMADPAKATDIVGSIFSFIGDLIKKAGGSADEEETDDFENDEVFQDPLVEIRKLIPANVRAQIIMLLRKIPVSKVIEELRKQGIKIPPIRDYSDDFGADEALEDPISIAQLLRFLPRSVMARVRMFMRRNPAMSLLMVLRRLGIRIPRIFGDDLSDDLMYDPFAY